MNELQQHCCDPSLLERYVAGDVNQQEEVEIENHLCDCEACTNRIEAVAAQRAIWDEAKAMLSDPSLRSDCLRSDYLTNSENDASDGPKLSRLVRSVLDSLAPTDDPNMLGRIDGYEVSGVIGSGGMGVVLKGVDPLLQRVVAVKVLAPHLASSGAARQRFAREAQATAAITHDNVIDIYAVAEANGLPYLVMPYSRGTTLQGRIDTEGPLQLVETLRIGFQIAAGLSAAHEQGLVHRDIKPANILLCDGVGRLQITDFGLARAVDDASVTKTGVIAGTPHFMSPEQARGEPVDRRSDLFSLGSLLYTCCTGHPPFRATGTFGILRRITDNQPRPVREINPSVPEWLCRVIEKLHAKDVSQRYQSAAEVARVLQQCLAHVQSPCEPLPVDLAPRKRIGLRVGLLAAAVLVLGISCVFVSQYVHSAKPVDEVPRVPSASFSESVSTDWVDTTVDSPAELLRIAGDLENETRLP
ncbi:MAG: serine/threonine-protein kinase [Pirellulaceae bacterium]